jgi:deazaflavin-dependent oxidoreductase (nitroreductase family)
MPPRTLMRLIKKPPQLAYALGLGPIIGRTVLLLTTTGRKSGQPRVTPLQYEIINNDVVIASARGTAADWYRNIVANPQVQVRIKNRRFTGSGEPVTDPGRIADFLAVRLERHPRMVGRIMRAAGLPEHPTRADLEAYATDRAMVIIHLAPAATTESETH